NRTVGDYDATGKARDGPARQEEEAAWTGEGLLRQQEQALSRGERVGRHGAEVRVRRPPPQEARFPPPVGGAYQRRGTRERPHLWPVDQRAEKRRGDARSQEPVGARGLEPRSVYDARP